MGSGDGRVPQKQKTNSRACYLGFARAICLEEDLHSWGMCFLASFLKQALLPRGREKTSQDGTPRTPRDPVSRFLLCSVNKHGVHVEVNDPQLKGALFSDPLSSGG